MFTCARKLACAGIVCAILAVAAVIGCEKKTSSPLATPVLVLAAASLSDSFREIGTAFEAANPGVHVEFSFAGSNQLRTQLENGAPGDVFASADRKQMDAAIASKVVDASTVQVFTHNRLALIVPKANPAGIGALADLARPGLKIVVADKAVPVGNYTRQMLERAAAAPGLGPTFVEAFDRNTVSFEENVAAVVAKIALAEADAGIAYMSDAAGSNGPSLTVIPIEPDLAPIADYMIAVTAHAGDPSLAVRFIAYIRSPEGAAVLTRRGFTVPENGAP